MNERTTFGRAAASSNTTTQRETSLRRDRLASTARARQLPPRSALATACGLGGGTVFVLPKDSRMGGTTTGSAMPVEVENGGCGSVEGSTTMRRGTRARHEASRQSRARVFVTLAHDATPDAFAPRWPGGPPGSARAPDHRSSDAIGGSPRADLTAYGQRLCDEGKARGCVPRAPMKQLHITTGSRCMAM